jgi:cytochrome bd-type quinol oxidase subunit 1
MIVSVEQISVLYLYRCYIFTVFTEKFYIYLYYKSRAIMNPKMLSTALAMLIAGIFSIATSSIAIECYNQDSSKDFKASKQNNFNFVVINLVSAIITVLLGAFCIYAAVQAPSY